VARRRLCAAPALAHHCEQHATLTQSAFQVLPKIDPEGNGIDIFEDGVSRKVLDQTVVNSARDIGAVIAPIRNKDASGYGGRAWRAARPLNGFYFWFVLEIMRGHFVPRGVKLIQHKSNVRDDRDHDEVDEGANMRRRK